MKNIIQKRYNKPVKCLGSGVNLWRPINHVKNEYIDIVFVGPIHPQKRPLDIVKAAQLINIPNLRLHFVGEIIDRKLYKKMLILSKEKNLKVFFYGSVSNEKLYNIYDLADLAIFVPEQQPWGIFPLETMLGGIPTIVSDSCGVNEFINNEIFLVETGNINNISSKIVNILEDIDYYKKETKKLAKMISEEYSWENYAKKMINIFEKY